MNILSRHHLARDTPAALTPQLLNARAPHIRWPCPLRNSNGAADPPHHQARSNALKTVVRKQRSAPKIIKHEESTRIASKHSSDLHLQCCTKVGNATATLLLDHEDRSTNETATASYETTSSYYGLDNVPVRVAAHPTYSNPAKLLRMLHGASHTSLSRMTRELHLHGNYRIHGPAVMRKQGCSMVVEVLPGGQVAYSTRGLDLQNLEEVLGDAQGRLTCILTGEHLEVCGDMELDAGLPCIDRVHKRVISISKLKEGCKVKVPWGGNLHYPISVQPRCDDCTCKNNRDIESWSILLAR